jgi:hypothetical protein
MRKTCKLINTRKVILTEEINLYSPTEGDPSTWETSHSMPVGTEVLLGIWPPITHMDGSVDERYADVVTAGAYHGGHYFELDEGQYKAA